MQTVTVVPADVPADDLAQRGIAVECQGVNDLGFQGMPEGFHERVVGQLARPVHALDDTPRREVRAVRVGGVLDPAIRMKDEPWRRLAPPQRPVQSGPRQGQVAPLSQAPAQDAARVAVHDRGQIAPLTADLQVRHVTDPDLIGSGGGAQQDPVGDGGEKVVRSRHVSVDARRARLQPGFTQQSGDALTSHAETSLRQSRLDARRTVGAGAGFEDRAYVRGQARILPIMRTG